MIFMWLLLAAVVLLLLLLLIIFLFLHFSIQSRKPFSLNKKHAVVTGASRGIGKQLALCLISRGCNVSIIAKDGRELEPTCKRLQMEADKLGHMQKVRSYCVDLRKGFEEVEAVMRRVEAELGPVDVLINNAGHSIQARFDEQPITDFEEQIKVTYLSAVNMTRCVVPGMKERRSGHISFVSSWAGQCTVFGYSAYSPLKFALRGLADALQMELLPYNINISVLYPLNTDSEGFRIKAIVKPEETRMISDSFALFTPQEVAEAHVKDIENGHYSTSMGRYGWMLNFATAGAAPETSTLRAFIQVLVAGLCRLGVLFNLGRFDAIVKKCYERRQAHMAQQESGQ